MGLTDTPPCPFCKIPAYVEWDEVLGRWLCNCCARFFTALIRQSRAR